MPSYYTYTSNEDKLDSNQMVTRLQSLTPKVNNKGMLVTFFHILNKSNKYFIC